MNTEMAREDVERLVRIETKLDHVLGRLIEDREAHDADLTQIRQDHAEDVRDIRVEVGDLTKRTGSLENWRYGIAAAFLMGAGGTVAQIANTVAPK